MDKYKEIEEKDRMKERNMYRDREERLKEKKEKGKEKINWYRKKGKKNNMMQS